MNADGRTKDMEGYGREREKEGYEEDEGGNELNGDRSE